MSVNTHDDEVRDFGLVARVPATRMWNACQPRRNPWRWHVLREHDEPPVNVSDPIEEPAAGRVGICCSGGGIRSASFNLGALQAVQKAKRLQTTHYLAAVSGGSYIAAAFSMIAKSRDGGTNDPPGDESDEELVTPSAPPFHPGSPEEQYLRNRASYMAPTGSGKLLLVWRVLLGLLVNLVLIGAVVTLVAAIITLYYRSANPGLIRPPAAGVPVGATPDGWVWGVGLALSAVGVVMGALSILVRPRRREGVRRFLEVWSFPLFAIGLVLFALEVVVPALIDVLRKDGSDDLQASRTVGAGVSASLAGILGAVLVQLRAKIADPGKAISEANGRLAALAPRARLALTYLAAGVLGPGIIFAMLVGATMAQLETTETLTKLAIPGVALALVLVFARFGDLNSWSLHPFYRRRLCTAFALRRIKSPGDPPYGHAEQRKDGELVPLSRTAVVPQVPPWDSRAWPELIVCAAANVSDPGVSPPGRGVTSFTFSAYEMGGPLVGGVLTNRFETALKPSRQRDFTLPAVVAMSGAAIAPSMGKATRPSVRFLMGMANVRLGVWLPNPRRIESFVRIRSTLRQDANGVIDKTKAMLFSPSQLDPKERASALTRAEGKQRFMPRPTPRYLLKELLGWNSINDKFLYVTDGGHYENLGLVELLRRGCTMIYCFDASGGKQLSELGDAIALARSELGVEITFADEELDRLKESGGLAKQRCATGMICYTRSVPEVTGTIVYAPTVMTADLPWDVHAFKEKDEAFPHHSTLDQLFTDQKFEAYRVLGYYAGQSAMKAMDSGIQIPIAHEPIAPSNGDRARAENGRRATFGEVAGRVRRFVRSRAQHEYRVTET